MPTIKGAQLSDSLLRKNLDFFKEKYPSLSQTLAHMENLNSSIIYNEDLLPENISINGVNLYGQPSKIYSHYQVETYLKNPIRLIFPNPNHCNLNHTTYGFFEHIQQYAQELELTSSAMKNAQIVDIGYFFCFGIGLGDYVEKIIDSVNATTLVLTEPVIEFFYHSLYNVDWTALTQKATDKGMTLKFVLGQDVDATTLVIQSIIHGQGITFLEGSYFYIHYPSWENQKALEVLKDRMDSFAISSGFFEDETYMSSNSYMNLRREEFTYIKLKRVLRQNIPAFVVASGPSLEKNIHHIKKWRDHVVLISCGSTLKILLQNGIRPDIQIENENVPAVYHIAKNLDKEHSLSDIILCATSTIQPGVARFFGEVWFYSRPGLSSTSIFADSDDGIEATAPLVANAAAALAKTIGFTDVYLFGVDCGKAKGKPTHHKDTIYNDDKALLGMSEQDYDDMFNIPVPGNFGGEILSSRFHTLSRLMFGVLARRQDLTMYNCSYGAALEGVQPLSSAKINFTHATNQQQKALANVRAQFKTYAPKEFLKKDRLKDMVENGEKFKKEIRYALEPVLEDADNFTVINQALLKFFSDQQDDLRGYIAMTRATLSSMVRLASFLGSRIKDVDTRKAFIKNVMGKYLEIGDWMTDQVQKMFAQMYEDAPFIPLPEVYNSTYKTNEDITLDSETQVEIEAYLAQIR